MCETSVPLIIDRYLAPETIEMFRATKVLSEAELHSRSEVKWETYVKKQQIESRMMGDLVINHVLPAAKRHQTMLLKKVLSVKQVFSADEAAMLNEMDYSIIRQIERHSAAIIKGVEAMTEARHRANRQPDERSKAIAYHDTVLPLMADRTTMPGKSLVSRRLLPSPMMRKGWSASRSIRAASIASSSEEYSMNCLQHADSPNVL